MLEAMNTGRYCQAAWQDLWLHSAIKLLGGRVHNAIGAAAAWREVLYFLGQIKCAAAAAYWHFGALDYLFALVKLGLVPTAGVSVTACGFGGAMGSVGIMISGRLVFRGELAVQHALISFSS